MTQQRSSLVSPARGLARLLAGGLLTLLLSWSAVPAFAQEKATAETASDSASEKDGKAEEKKEEKKSDTLKVAKEKLEVLVQTDGTFQSTETEEIILAPEKWTSLKVETVLPHGSKVNEGDPLLVLATEDIDKELDSLKRSVEAQTLAVRLAQDELRFLKESTAMDLQQAELSARIAAEELEYYENVREERSLKGADLALRMAKFRLEYAQEELDQLRQMYEADDLTEPTEEIILKRTARDVEMAQHSLEEAELRHERQTQVLFPREKRSLVDTQARAALSQAKSAVALPLQFRKKEIEFEQLEKDFADKKDRLQRLQQDRQLMTVYAPRGGLLYYGAATRGKWGDLPMREKQLTPGASVAPHQVLMTIVNPAALEVVLGLSESQLALVSPGQPVVIRPEAVRNLQLRGEVVEVKPVVQSDGKYPALVKLDTLPSRTSLTPGMSGKVTILAYRNESAVMIPESALFRDDFSERSDPYVWLAAEEGAEPKKKYVRVGHTKDKKVEILEGLSVGDEILKSAP